METSTHNLSALFAQLGLPSGLDEIDRFIRQHQIAVLQVPLEQATFWTPAQADFLREALQEDSDWSDAVDELNARLHPQN